MGTQLPTVQLIAHVSFVVTCITAIYLLFFSKEKKNNQNGNS